MRIGIVSDIHGNLEAAENTLKFLRERTDTVVSLGDVVGYGPDPAGCIDLVEEFCTLKLRGNHEETLVKSDFARLNKTAAASLMWTEKQLAPGYFSKMGLWQTKEREEGLFFAHASITDPLFKYVVSKQDAEDEFLAMEGGIAIVGHTHLPGGFKKYNDTGKLDIIYSDFNGELHLKIDSGCLYILNAGSVGQPRDGFPYSCASIYDSTKFFFTIVRIQYPLEKTSKKIIEVGLPSILARRIRQGI